MTLDHKTSLKSMGYICSNSQKYTVWVKIIHFSFILKSLGYWVDIGFLYAKIIRVSLGCAMTIFCKCITVNI